jgi:hypothetical protein
MLMIGSIKGLVSVTILAFTGPSLLAQEIVHAMVGTIAERDPANSSITLQLPDKKFASFDFKPHSSAPISFDKTLRDESATATGLPKEANHVIVYYYGLSPAIAVSVKDLGKEIEAITGTIVGISEANRTITVQSETGGQDICYLNDQTTVETPYGAVDGTKYSPRKGEKVNVVCNYEVGKEVAQFIQPLND